MGGIIIGSKKELTKWKREEGKEKIEGVVEGKIKYGRESLRIVVYVNGDMERKLKRGVERVDGRKGRNVDNHRRF